MRYIRSYQFFMPMSKLPSGTAQQRQYAFDRRSGKVTSYPRESYKQAKKILARALAQHKLDEPLEGCILLDVEYLYETKDKNKIDRYKTSKPDGDNLLKVLKDQMNMMGFFSDDDAQVCCEAITRYWVRQGEGGIRVHIAQIEKDVNL